MIAATHRGVLSDRLPAVAGRYVAGADLGRMSWFRTGGAAEILFEPAGADDLRNFLAAKPEDIAVTVIGLGSNLLVRDGGVAGVVIRLGAGFDEITVEQTHIRAGAGAIDLRVAQRARDAGIAGLEFLAGVPGTIGGAIRMNAGAYGRDMSDVTMSAEAIDGDGGIAILDAAALGFGYRSVGVPESWIFTAATLAGAAGDIAEIGDRIAAITRERADTQPLKTRTGGSTFVNPAGAKAWEVIDRAGCRGLRRGGAMVSEKHCNFLINTGTATAADIELLGEDVRARVRETTGIDLEWEIQRIGTSAEAAN